MSAVSMKSCVVCGGPYVMPPSSCQLVSDIGWTSKTVNGNIRCKQSWGGFMGDLPAPASPILSPCCLVLPLVVCCGIFHRLNQSS